MTAQLSVRKLSKHFAVRQTGGWMARRKLLKAVDEVSFDVAPGEMLGIVGESGSGKSTTARLVLGHLPASEGRVLFGGQDIEATQGKAWRQMRRRLQMVYQDPLAALDPRIPVVKQIEEPLIVHVPGLSARDRRDKARRMMADVGLSDHHGDRFVHELSGGQRQRVVLARALVVEPDLLICDEPVSALDVSVQAQVLNVLEAIRARSSFTGVFISHDLKVVRQITDRVAVMYLGRLVEIGAPDEVFHRPLHPYSQALVSAVPRPGRSARDRIILSGDPPNPIDIPPGCAFHPRCPVARPLCRATRPDLVGDGARAVACHLVNHPSFAARQVS